MFQMKKRVDRYHEYQAPEDEDDNAHLHVTMKTVLILFGCVQFWFTLIGIYISAHPHYTHVYWKPDEIAYLKSHWKWHDTNNGSIYSYNSDGTIRYIRDWDKPFFVEQMDAYEFGFGNWSYCRTRNGTSPHTWATSIFRASMLYSSVQTPIRYGVLFFMPYVILMSYTIAKAFFLQQGTLLSAIIAGAYTVNEFCVHISYFAFTTVHVMFDRDYIPYSTLFLSCCVVFTSLKLIIRNLIQTTPIMTCLRIAGVITFAITYPVIEQDVKDYSETILCDTFAAPEVGIYQLVCMSIICLNTWNDIKLGSKYLLISASTYDEIEQQPQPKKSIFIRPTK